MPNPTRVCIGCAQSDDHPRIIVAGLGADHAADITWHHDCWVIAHPDNGTDWGVTEMHRVVEHAAGKQGDELRTYLLSPEHREFKAGLESERETQLAGAKA